MPVDELSVLPVNDVKIVADTNSTTNITKWSFEKFNKEAIKSIQEMEINDVRGITNSKYLNAFLFSMVLSNYGLASNRGLKSDPQKILSNPTVIPALVAGMAKTVGKQAYLLRGPALKYIFLDSLPDVFTELQSALGATNHYDKVRYDKLPGALVTAIVHTALSVMHVALQVPQIAFLTVSTFAQFLKIPLNKLLIKDPKDPLSTGQKIGYGVLTVLAGIAALPLQVFGIVGNTVGYVRHVADSLITIGKVATNFVIDSLALSGRVLLQKDVNGPKEFKELVSSAADKIGYAVKDLSTHLFKLLPVALTLTAAYFTGGAALLAAPAATGVGMAIGAAAVMAATSNFLSIAFIKLKRVVSGDHSSLIIEVNANVNAKKPYVHNFDNKPKKPIELQSFRPENTHANETKQAPTEVIDEKTPLLSKKPFIMEPMEQKALLTPSGIPGSNVQALTGWVKKAAHLEAAETKSGALEKPGPEKTCDKCTEFKTVLNEVKKVKEFKEEESDKESPCMH